MAGALPTRDKRALMLLGGALLMAVLLQTDFLSPAAGGTASAASVEATEQRLLLAQTKAKQAPLADGEAVALGRQLAAAETQLLKSETTALAQAEMREIMDALLKAEGIAMDSSQFGAAELEGQHYVRIPLLVDFNCGIEQFVNLMASVANAPQLLTTHQIRLSPANESTKSVRVRFTVAGYVPVARAPELRKNAPQAPGASS